MRLSDAALLLAMHQLEQMEQLPVLMSEDLVGPVVAVVPKVPIVTGLEALAVLAVLAVAELEDSAERGEPVVPEMDVIGMVVMQCDLRVALALAELWDQTDHHFPLVTGLQLMLSQVLIFFPTVRV